MKIKLQIISDIHLEFRDPARGYDFLKQTAPILLMCGDVCALGSPTDFKHYEKFIEHIYDKYEHIIHVPGNHEYYCSDAKYAKTKKSMDEIDAKVKEYLKWYPKVHYLNNSVLRLNIQNHKFYFIGTTMWSKIPRNNMESIRESMNDYVYIWMKTRALIPQDVVDMHRKAAGFIKRAIERAKRDNATAIVITHHKPYTSEDGGELAVAYEVDMEKLIQAPLKLWAYGHTHTHDDRKINGVRICNDGLGYPYERDTGYVKGFSVDVSSD